MINPTRLISCNLLGKKISYGSPETNVIPKQETSVLWYKESEFIDIFKEYAKDNPTRPLKEFIALFRGFGDNSSDTLLFLQKIPTIQQSRLFDSKTCKRASVPLGDITTEEEIKALYAAMKTESKPIKDKRTLRDTILRPVGEEKFKTLCDKNKWELIKYDSIIDDTLKNPKMFEYVEIKEIRRSSRQEDLPLS